MCVVIREQARHTLDIAGITIGILIGILSGSIDWPERLSLA